MSLYCLVAIVMWEHLYLQDWLNYHKFLGFDKFFLYIDPQETTPYQLYDPNVQIVKYDMIKDMPSDMFHFKALQHYHKVFSSECSWTLHSDTDEYPYFGYQFNNSVRDVIRYLEKKNYHAVVMPWYFFGTSFHEAYEATPVPVRFILRENQFNFHVKTLYETQYFANRGDPHAIAMKDGYKSVDICGNVIEGPFDTTPCWNNLAMFHYKTKSKMEHYKRRIVRHKRGDFTDAQNEDLAQGTTFENHKKFHLALIKDDHPFNSCIDDRLAQLMVRNNLANITSLMKTLMQVAEKGRTYCTL